MAIPSQDLKKTCNVCGDSKSLAGFYETTYIRKDGSHPPAAECKECRKKRTARLYHNHSPEKKAEIRRQENQYARSKRAAIKDAVFAQYGGYRCACCGETEKSFLTLDHINNDGAEFRRMLVGTQARGGGYVTYRWLVLHEFPEGFQVLCANCQHGKRMNGGICPHQVRCNDQEKSVEPSVLEAQRAQQSSYRRNRAMIWSHLQRKLQQS